MTTTYTREQWRRARAAYESGLYPIAEIAKAVGIKPTSLRNRINREKWVRSKKVVQADLSTAVMHRTREKMVDLLAEADLRAIDLAGVACKNMIAAIHAASEEPDHWRRHVVVTEDRTTIQGGTQVHKDAETRLLDTINGRNLLDTARALKELKALSRLMEGVLTAYEQEMLRIQRERLALDNKRAGVGEEIEAETGVAEIPATDWALLDKAVPDPGGQAGGSGA